MKNFLVLRVLDRLRKPLEAAGADYPALRIILQAKLTMDSRRLPTALSGGNRKEAKDGDRNLFLQSLWLYGLIGLILIPFTLLGSHYLLQMSIVFGMTMFMVATTLISDFSTVLLDLRDKPILHTRPVNKRTLALAKAIHILYYLFQLTGVLTAAPWLAGSIRHGIGFALLFPALMALAVMLLLLLTAFVYLAILRLFDGEKLKDLINYVQIGLSLGMTVGYQLIGRAFDLKDLKLAFVPHWWEIFVIPLWYGSAFEWLLNGNGSGPVAGFAMLALVVPVAALFAYIKLGPAFERHLQKLTEQQARPGRQADGRFGLTGRLAALLCRTPLERACFRFAVRMMGQERDFKLKVYPSIGFSLIFPFILMFHSLQEDGLSSLKTSKEFLTVYFGVLMVPTIVTMLKHSGKYKGAWIFRAAPLEDYTPYLKGAVKAFIIRLLVPVYLLQALVFTWLFGARVLPDMAAVFAGMLLFTALCCIVFPKTLPFSVPFSAVQRNDFGRTMGLLGLILAFAGLHFVVLSIPYGVWGYIILLLLLNLIFWKMVFPKRGLAAADLLKDGRSASFGG